MPSTQDSSKTFIRAERLITGADDQKVIAHAVIEVQDGRISSITQEDPSSASVEPVTEGATVHHYSDATALPGLIDAHAHVTLAGDGRTYEQMAADPDELLALTAVANMRNHLSSGVTTLRDNGGRNLVPFMVREGIRRGYILGPRLLLSGRPVTPTQGHFHWCNGVADSEAEIRSAVRTLVAQGADHIKIMASGGSTAGHEPYYASYNTSELSTAVETAHEFGRLTTAHCRATASMQNAVEAGLDCMEHAEFLVPGSMREYGSGLTPSGDVRFDTELARRIIDSGMYISLTLQQGGYERLVALREKAEHRVLGDDEQSQLKALEHRFDTKMNTMTRLLELGAQPRLVVSSDAGPYSTIFGRMDFNYELAIRGGLDPIEAVRAMTSIAARACGVEDEVGTLESGKVADILVVRGDPLKRPETLAGVLAVYKDGDLVVSNT